MKTNTILCVASSSSLAEKCAERSGFANQPHRFRGLTPSAALLIRPHSRGLHRKTSGITASIRFRFVRRPEPYCSLDAFASELAVAPSPSAQWIPAAFTASESFEVCTDLGSTVSRDYYERRPFQTEAKTRKCLLN